MSLDGSIGKLRDTGRPVLLPDGRVDLTAVDFSSIDMYLRCPKQYEFRYIKGQRRPPDINLAEGIGHHAALEEDNKQKIATGKMMTASQLTDLFEHNFDKTVETFNKECGELGHELEWEGQSEDSIYKRASILHNDYAGKFSPKIKPVAAEKTFFEPVKVDGIEFNLFGQIDFHTDSFLGDYKTTKRPKSEADAKNSLQLSLYSWVTKIKKVSLVSLCKEKPHVEMTEMVEKTAGNWMWGLKVIASAVKGIRAGSFPMTNPSAFPPPWWCSAKFCGYWSQCRGMYER